MLVQIQGGVFNSEYSDSEYIIMELISLSKTQYDKNILITLLNNTKGKSIEIEDNNQLYIDILRKVFDSNILQHIQYGFVLIGSKEFFFKLMQHQHIVNINVTESVKLDCYVGVMSATLYDLVDLILFCSTGEEYFEIREMANKIQKYLELEGLYYIFHNFMKQKMLSDETFRLVSKYG